MRYTIPVLLLSAGLIASSPGAAQQNITGLPQISPPASTTQTVGINRITVDYHRPAVLGRTIWGGIVPKGQVWRAGANDNTVLSFTHPVKIGSQELAAGSYGLHMIPSDSEWTVILSHNSTSWGSFSYQDSEDAARTSVMPEAAPFQEWLSYEFRDPTADGATLVLRWEELAIPLRISVDTHEQVLTKIRNDLRHLPGFGWQGWATAANYTLQSGVALDEGLQWIDRSIQLQETFTNLATKAQLLTRSGDTSGAETVIARALNLGSENELNQTGYQMLGAGNTPLAIRIFRKNVERHPQSWNVHDSLAEALGIAGQSKEAIEHYRHAHAMAPEAQHARIEQAIAAIESGP